MDAMTGASTQAVTGPTRTRWWDSGRVAGVAGCGFVAALVISLITLPADDAHGSAADIIARYADGSAGYLRYAALEEVGIALFIVFAGGLSAVLHGARAGRSTLTGVATIGAAVAAALQLGGYAIIATLAHGTAARGNDDVVLALYDLSSAVFTSGMCGFAVFFAATAVAILRNRALGRTVGWAAALTAVVTLSAAGEGALGLHGNVGFLAVLMAHAWVLLASVALLRRRAGRA
jgi:hypothetical protein